MSACSNFDETPRTEAVATDGATETAGGIEAPPVPVATAGPDLPESIAESGTIRNGVAYTYPPMAFIADGSQTGVDHEIAIALGDAMGLRTETIDAGSTSAVFPGLQSGRFDMNVGSQGITGERLELFDMISYSELAYNFLVKAGNPSGLTPEACGGVIGQSLGSAFIAIVEGLSNECVAAGKEAIEIQTFQDSGAIRVAIETGRIDGTIGQVTGNIYNAQDGEFETVGDAVSFEINGIVVDKGTPGLAEAILTGLQSIMEDGTYVRILEDYGVGAVALEGEPQIFSSPDDLDSAP